ncbi:replication protein A 70 kDa DNA-binding subunit B-like [Macadamia integrifolia]|uniref:replication protein A 70 kDa DNA-binding subunit B-like n=1 Tax=Macadamia integrifolia TaxID=60698 RepID=UPI001C4EEA5E|nr:replication protein A 70 kDa DNA-binding subunit B-like [Macadamia integrifolia]
MLTLWDNYAINEGSKLMDIIGENPVIAFSSIKQIDYQGGSLGTTSFTTIDINPMITEADELKKWFTSKNGSKKILLKASNEDKYKKVERIEMKDLMDKEYKTILNQYYYFEGNIVNLENEKLWYNACKTCKKKVQLKGDHATCDKCQNDDTEYTQKYFGKFKIKDSTEIITVTIFEELETLIGCSAIEYARSSEKYKQKLDVCLSKNYYFYFKMDSKNEGSRKSRSIVIDTMKERNAQKRSIIDVEDDEDKKGKKIKIEKD